MERGLGKTDEKQDRCETKTFCQAERERERETSQPSDMCFSLTPLTADSRDLLVVMLNCRVLAPIS